MSLGSWLSKVGGALNRGITDYQRTRDFGPDWQEQLQRKQQFINQVAQEREAEKLLKQAQLEEDRAARKEDLDARRGERDVRLRGTALDLMVGSATKGKDGAWKLPTEQVVRTLGLDPLVGGEVAALALGQLSAKEAAEKRALDERNAASGRDFGEQLSLARERQKIEDAAYERRRNQELADKFTLAGLAPLLAVGKPQARSGASVWMDQAEMQAPKGASWQQKVDLARQLEERWRVGPGAGGAPPPAVALPGPSRQAAGQPARVGRFVVEVDN
jgi:hypothetical protein